MRLLSNRIIFQIWSYLALPLLIGAFWIAFQTSFWLGTTFLLVFSLWFYDMGVTTCSRCGNYGTNNCGLQARLVPLMFRRRSVKDVSPLRVRLHLAFDLVMMVFGVGIYAQELRLLPIMVVWSLVGVFAVYGPGRHHGLLYVLKARQNDQTNEPQQLVTLQHFCEDQKPGD